MAARSRNGMSLHAQMAVIGLISLMIGVGAGFVVIVISTQCCATVRSLWGAWGGRDLRRAQERRAEAIELASLLAVARSRHAVTRIVALSSEEQGLRELENELERNGWLPTVESHAAVLVPLDPHTAIVFETHNANRVLWHASLLMAGATFASFLIVVAIWSRRSFTTPLQRLTELARMGADTPSSSVLPRRAAIQLLELERCLNDLRVRMKSSSVDRTPPWVGLSHDLRAPLTRLRLRAERVAPELREGMLREIDRLVRLVDLTLHALKHESGMERFEKVDIASLIGTVCDEFADVGYRVIYRGPLRLVAMCAPDSLSRAIANIVDNGVKHANEVTVELRLAGESSLEIMIVDDGPGMSESQQTAAFEPFERGSTKNQAAGFGLGLSIARGIIEAHGGDIRLQNRRPHGLIVRISLPVRRRD